MKPAAGTSEDMPKDFPKEKAARLTAISFDIDGVLTDGRITYTDDGLEIKSFHVQDGAALKLLMANGVHVALITGRESPIVERRARELGIAHVYQGSEHKAAAFEDFLGKAGAEPWQSAHVGDDLPDLVLFDQVGLSVSVPNGHPTVQLRADWVTRTRGGEGVARELAELILKSQAKWTY